MKKIGRYISKNKKEIFQGFLSCLMIIAIPSIIYAAIIINSSEVAFDNPTGLNSKNVQDAIDELYAKAKNYCPEGYICTSCDYEAGTTWDFAYTGDIQKFTIPCDGVYKLEVWGAQSGDTTYAGKGGYSSGYAQLDSNESLYVVCGGVGGKAVYLGTAAGGYNGGGSGWDYGYDVGVTGGGGATHIAKVTGLLKDIGYEEFVTNKKGLIVAGGAGGSIFDFGGYVGISMGGAGGGYNGGQGTTGNGGTSLNTYATQTSGYKFGQGFEPHDFSYAASGGGGGGLYGGTGSQNYYSGGGGSGYIGGVTNGTTEAGVNNGAGKAKITLISY